MRKSCLFLIFIFFIFGITPLFAQVEFNIRFFDRRIYYAQGDDPILVQVTITNNTPLPYRFRLADDRVFSLDFDIRTMTNREVPQADSFIRKRTQNRQILYREIAIQTGESYSFTEDLKDFAAFTQPGSYRVKARIFPELITTNSSVLESNYLTLSIRPPLIRGQDGIPLEMDVATGAALVKQNLPPDEVITYMLIARQREQWERFFLYMDLEAMLSREASQRRRWQAETEEGRRRMVAEYRQMLQSPVIHSINGDISQKPDSFEILRTIYNNEEGQVTARLRFRQPNYIEVRRYTYILQRRDNYWVIVDYSVEGEGTEDL